MREFINLIEEVQSDLFSQVAAVFKRLFGHEFTQVNHESEAFYGTDDPREIVATTHEELMKNFSSGSATIYRVIAVPDSIIAAMRPRMTLGPHDSDEKHASWTLAPEELVMSAIETERVHSRELQNFFAFKVNVALSVVNIPITLAQNIEVHWEQEIALKRGLPITLIGIYRFSEHSGLGNLVRPDLVGAIMLS